MSEIIEDISSIVALENSGNPLLINYEEIERRDIEDDSSNHITLQVKRAGLEAHISLNDSLR